MSIISWKVLHSFLRSSMLSVILWVLSFTLCSSSVQAVPFLSPDVLIDVGHGGIDGGSFHHKLLEKDINLAIAKLLKQSLKEYNIHAILNRTTDVAPSDDNHWLPSRSRHRRDLAQRKLVMEELHPEVIVSLHCNWSPKPSSHGPVVLYQSNQQSYILAALLQDQLNALYHTSYPSIYGKTFYILNHSPRPTVIVEMGFISSTLDQPMLTIRENQLKIVEAIRSAIWEYLFLFYMR